MKNLANLILPGAAGRFRRRPCRRLARRGRHLLQLSPVAAAAAPRPNIVVILVDDMGFSDIGCYGSEIPTPNLDKLAAGGLRFTQFYNTGRCCPTRASLLTGLYPHQAGVGHMIEDGGVPGYRGRLNDRCVTIAEVLRRRGLLHRHERQVARRAEPRRRALGTRLPAQPQLARRAASTIPRASETGFSSTAKALADDAPELPKNWYTTDLWTDFGIKFIDEALAAKKPFFLYLAYNAPHFPLQAPADEIAQFRGKYKIGWDKLREQRHARQMELGVVDKAWPLSPRPDEVKAWDTLSDAEQGPLRPHHGHLRRLRGAHGHGGRPAGGGAQAARRARQHADPLPVRQRRQRRERSARAGWKAIRPARPARPSSAASRGRRWRTRRSAATSISTTKAASPRR